MIILDTHAFVWLASDPKKLSENVWNCLESNSDELAVSIVSAWEIAILCKKGRLELPLTPGEFIEKALAHHKITELVLSREVILEATGLPDIHNDPFDRILIAEARIRKAQLVTKDRQIHGYPDIHAIW